jgi:glycosyltransferase involved in cell wall biosynthesis
MISAYPAISIVTPSYNQGEYLEKTILSVLDQDYPNLEYIIIDGGSTDDSVEIIKKHERFLKYWVSEPDRGQSHALNKGFRHAAGDLLTWLNSDDYYMPGTLHKFAEIAAANPEASVFVGAGRIVLPTGRVRYYKNPPPEISIESLYNWLSGENFMQPSSLFRRDAWEKAGPLDEELHIAFDLDLWLRMAKKGCRFVSTEELLSTALGHDGAKTTAYGHLMTVDVAIVIMRHGGEYAARHHIEDIARKLSVYEPNIQKIINHPLYKLLGPMIKVLFKPAVRWRDTLPRWSNQTPETLDKK